jgi:hypothetical protein
VPSGARRHLLKAEARCGNGTVIVRMINMSVPLPSARSSLVRYRGFGAKCLIQEDFRGIRQVLPYAPRRARRELGPGVMPLCQNNTQASRAHPRTLLQ